MEVTCTTMSAVVDGGKARVWNLDRPEEQGTFTIPKEPVGHRAHGIETFNVLRGGEHLFMPSLSALTCLAQLSD